MSSPTTPWVETEYLVAVMHDDRDQALAELRKLLPGELRRFVRQLETALERGSAELYGVTQDDPAYGMGADRADA